MKLGKTSRLFLAIGILVIAAASLGVAYSQQVREQSRLSQELSLAQLRLEEYSPQQLSAQEKELKRQLEAAKASLSESVESIEASDTLFEIAKACDVEIIEIGSSLPTSQELEGATYSVLPLTVKLEGDVPNLINFILKLDGEFPTSVVKSVDIKVPETTDTEGEESEEETEEEPEKSSANLRLLIYTYRGD